MDFIEISVIVPVYNVEKYLCQCVESILSQTYRNFELLLIDDGSKDNSGNICEEYAKNDPRIRVLHVENGGASYARNIGLNIAVGDWVTFVDADDWVSSNYLEELVKDVDSDDMLILYPPVKVIDGNQFKAEVNDFNFCSNKGKRLFVEYGFLSFSEPHSKLFSLSVIRKYDIRFPEDVIVGEDGIFISRYLFYTNGIKVRNTPIYYYRYSETSVQKKIYDSKIEWRAYQLWKFELEKLCNQLGINSESDSIYNLLSSLLTRYMNSVVCDSKKSIKDRYILLKNIPLVDKRNYGRRGISSIQGRLLRFIVNNDCDLLLFILLIFRQKIYRK